MYDATDVFEAVDDNVVLFLVLGAGALACNWYYFFACARLARRDRCAPMALWATTVFIGHDASYLLNYDDWFVTYDHWFPKLFWVGLIVTNLFEMVFFVQTVRYGRRELAPRMTQKQWIAYCVGALVTGVVFWSVTRTYLDDPLYLMTFLVTFGMCAPATFAFMVRRGDRTGVGADQLWAYLGIGVFYIALTTVVLGGAFRDPVWLLGSVVCVALSVGLIALYRRLPAPGSVGVA
ncbi:MULTISPECIES: hypothetical protein [unclassified Nocardioides]|uniref:hypothetical protein n=1 Tax=unclassified Nocardioides TaxID=2615069 RepID=UPI000702BD37|nr:MULTISPECIES: hypothetical protein [unclassified Nocardioides]KRC59786.1 hypothetical protein ASE19_01845 [Nocardioides sp. Root79]KRC68387.1 hypothetical protein ASE20_16115 [Nocardioides sp. Root240]